MRLTHNDNCPCCKSARRLIERYEAAHGLLRRYEGDFQEIAKLTSSDEMGVLERVERIALAALTSSSAKEEP